MHYFLSAWSYDCYVSIIFRCFFVFVFAYVRPKTSDPAYQTRDRYCRRRADYGASVITYAYLSVRCGIRMYCFCSFFFFLSLFLFFFLYSSHSFPRSTVKDRRTTVICWNSDIVCRRCNNTERAHRLVYCGIK